MFWGGWGGRVLWGRFRDRLVCWLVSLVVYVSANFPILHHSLALIVLYTDGLLPGYLCIEDIQMISRPIYLHSSLYRGVLPG